MSRRYITKSGGSANTLLVAIGIAESSPALASNIFVLSPSLPQIISL